MHAQGPSAWFDDGKLERELILKMGEPWEGLEVIELGCGEGDLCAMMKLAGANPLGIDYSQKAISTAKARHGDLKDKEGITYLCSDYHDVAGSADRLVLQGILEHLDDPFTELAWMIEHFKPSTVITTSPGFLNPRGIVWMTLHMLGAVMSKTDLHFLNPWEFEEFCHERLYQLKMETCDLNWAFDVKMLEDLQKRIPLALKDGGLPVSQERIAQLLKWLSMARHFFASWQLNGAVIGYRIDI